MSEPYVRADKLTRLANELYSEHRFHDGELCRLAAFLPAELDRLRERLGPKGLIVREIDGAGHYVNEKVAAELDSLRAEVERLREALREFDEFAWTAVKADCEESRQNLQRKIDKARALLASTAPKTGDAG